MGRRGSLHPACCACCLCLVLIPTVLPLLMCSCACRLCLHPDVQASSDRLMAHLNSSSTGSKQSQGAVGAHAQLRSRGAGGRLLVEFGSGAAAGAALADAAAVAEAMALKDGQV